MAYFRAHETVTRPETRVRIYGTRDWVFRHRSSILLILVALCLFIAQFTRTRKRGRDVWRASRTAPAQEAAPQAALPEKPARKALPKKEPQQALPKKEEKQALPEKEKQHALPQKPEQTALPKKEDKAALTAPPQPKALTGRKKASKRKKRS